MPASNRARSLGRRSSDVWRDDPSDRTALVRDARRDQRRYEGQRDGISEKAALDEVALAGELLFHPRRRRIAAFDFLGVEIDGRRVARDQNL